MKIVKEYINEAFIPTKSINIGDRVEFKYEGNICKGTVYDIWGDNVIPYKIIIDGLNYHNTCQKRKDELTRIEDTTKIDESLDNFPSEFLLERYLDAYNISKQPTITYTVLEHVKRLPNIMTVEIDIHDASPKNYGMNTPQELLKYLENAYDFFVQNKKGWFTKSDAGKYAKLFWNIKGLKIKPYQTLPRKRALAFIYGMEAMIRFEYLSEPVRFYGDYFSDVYNNLEKEQKQAVRNLLRLAKSNQL